MPVAAACGFDGMLQRLLEKGCDINTSLNILFPNRVLKEGNALSLACRYGRIGVVQILLSRGVDPNWAPEIEKLGRPLIEAVTGGHQQVAECLLDARASPNITIKPAGDPLLTLAVQSEPMFRMLLNRGADSSTLEPRKKLSLLEKVLGCQDVSVLKTLLDSQSDLSINDAHGRSKCPTQLAAEAGTAMFEYMMDYAWHRYGQKPNPQSSNSHRALQTAIDCQHAEVVEILLQRYGLWLESENVVKYLESAARGKDPTRSGLTLDVLLRNSADINARRNDGQTCLSLLSCSGSAEAAKLVIERGANYPLTQVFFTSKKYLLTVAVGKGDVHLVDLLLVLIEAQGISSEDVDPHLKQAQDEIPEDDELLHVQLSRCLDNFRWRRRYPVA